MKTYKTIELKKAILEEIKSHYNLPEIGAFDGLTFEDELTIVPKCVNVSTLSGKLKGYYSISTSVKKNPYCNARMLCADSICHHCYAVKNLERYDALSQNLDINFEIMNRFLISDKAWSLLTIPTTNGDARIESHVDVATVTCARNYIRIIRTHSHLKFGVWTKNWNIWRLAFELECGKPENMTFIISSDKVNKIIEIDERVRKYVDHVFTVYDKKYITANGITVNCGAKDCSKCRICYRKGTDFYVNEIKK